MLSSTTVGEVAGEEVAEIQQEALPPQPLLPPAGAWIIRCSSWADVTRYGGSDPLAWTAPLYRYVLQNAAGVRMTFLQFSGGPGDPPSADQIQPGAAHGHGRRQTDQSCVSLGNGRSFTRPPKRAESPSPGITGLL